MKINDFLNNYNLVNPKLVRPYVIAEAGVNHEGSIETAKRLIYEAAEGGAHAIKFQTYKAETIAAKESPAYWDLSQEPTTSQFELFKKHDKFWKSEFEKLKVECDKVGIEFMSTPFDVESAQFLNDMMPIFKISSSDLTNTPFIRFMCEFGKPIILSTGASHLWEVQRAVNEIDHYNLPLCLMHCVLNYPTMDENANLGMIRALQQEFPEKIIGYSDHTLPKDMKTLEIATTLGAVVLEKHFTHDKKLPGNDHYHAMDKEDLKVFNKRMDELFSILGSQKVEALASEAPAIQNARRSLVSSMSIKNGEVVTKEHLTWKRPASGITPADFDSLLGKKAIVDIEEDTVLQWNMFS